MKLKTSFTDVYNKDVLYTETGTDGLLANINLSNYYDKPEINHLREIQQLTIQVYR